MSKEDRKAWVARKPCGCVIGVCSTDIAEDLQSVHLAPWVIDGLVVKVEDFDAVKVEPTFFNCPHGQLKMALESP